MPDFDRLAMYSVYRRVALGYQRRQDFAADSRISLRTLGDIETAHRDNFRPATLTALEQALRWEPGSAKRVLDGGEPVEKYRTGGGASPRPGGNAEFSSDEETSELLRRYASWYNG